jgi:hypothetical protein
MTQSAKRRAAWTAALVAVPVAMLAGVAAFALAGGFRTSAAEPAPGSTTVPVPMPAASLAGRQADLCRDLVARLPAKVRQLNRRPVTRGSQQNAAYGDPALTVSCAGGTRPDVAATETVYPISGVCWYARTRPEGTVWTTLDREVPVMVAVPARYSAPGQWVAAFSAPVASAVPSAPGAPTGCTG